MRTSGSGAVVVLLRAALTAGCARGTGRLSPEQESRFQAEGIVRRADDQVFRYTHDAGTRESGWEDRDASIVVTRRSGLIHKNDRIGVEITPGSRRFYEVRRTAGRVLLRAGSGKSAETWSFEASDDAPGRADDIRAVIKASKSVANGGTDAP